jgi:hypothetical protein
VISHGKPNAKRNAPWPDPTEAQLRQAEEWLKALLASQRAANETRKAVTRLLVKSHKVANPEDKSYAIEDALDLLLAERHPEE